MNSPEMLKRLNSARAVKKSRRLAKLTNGLVDAPPKDAEKGRANFGALLACCVIVRL